MSQNNPQHLNDPSQSSLDGVKKLDEVLDCLKGTMEQEGLVSMVRNINKTIHDDKAGLLPRVALLEQAAQRQTGWVMGVCFIGGLVGVVIGWCAEFFSHKP